MKKDILCPNCNTVQAEVYVWSRADVRQTYTFETGDYSAIEETIIDGPDDEVYCFACNEPIGKSAKQVLEDYGIEL